MPADDGAVRSRPPETATPSEDVVPVHIVNTCFGLAQMMPAQKYAVRPQSHELGAATKANKTSAPQNAAPMATSRVIATVSP